MTRKKTALLPLVLFLCARAYTFELEGYRINTELLETDYASAPRIVDKYLLFTFESPEKPLFVGAAFDFDNYTKIHRYRMLPNGVFFLAIKIPPVETLKYRLIVDGIWMADPFNSNKIIKDNLVEISYLHLPVTPDDEKDYPLVKNGETHFYYSGEKNTNVFLAGSFNGWDPFMYRMNEKRPGEYFISLRLPPGQHYYSFITGGEVKPDSRNPLRAWDRHNREVSKFVVQ